MSLDGTSENDCTLSRIDDMCFEDLECWSSKNELECKSAEPSIGMEFNSLDEAIQFYESYAGSRGFSTRRHSNTKNKDGPSSQRFVCSKEGFYKKQKQQEDGAGTSVIIRTPERRYSSTRCGCKAYIRFCKVKSGVWSVTAYNGDHNHDLVVSPAKIRNLRTLRNITKEDKQTMLELRAQNVRSSQIWNYFGERAGGSSNLRFKKKDVTNLIAAQNKILVGVDVETTMDYFRKRQEDDPEFFFDIKGDDSGVTKNIIWIDGRARRAYVEFGDVVTFDTTYNTNKYSMPVGIFIGVNHHWQSVIFGFCLLRDEKASNFSWLFTTWLSAMYDKAPASIITDQYPAMKEAIKQVFPTTVHRCCLWHVLRKAREHLGLLYGNKPGFKKELLAIIHRSLIIEDFEKSWNQMIKKYNLEKINHLNVMYKKRAEWVPAYFQGTFFAGMSTTQRSEAANAIMKLWVDGHACIYRFVQHAEKVVEGIWQRESDEDYRTMNETPTLESLSNIQVEAREVYTTTSFKKFKEIMYASTNGVVVELERDTLYEVNITSHPEIPNWIPESHQVWVDKPNSIISCNCKGFEFQGLLCPHAIKVMEHVMIKKLPSRYVLKRWTKGVNEGTKRSILYKSTDLGESVELQAMRIASLQPKWLELVKWVSKSDETCRSFDADMEKLKKKYLPTIDEDNNKEVCKALSIVDSKRTLQPDMENISAPEYLDPPLSQCKGRKRKPQRFKPPIEKQVKKQRTCGYCNEKGHNINGCKQKKWDERVKGSKEKYEEDRSSEED